MTVEYADRNSGRARADQRSRGLSNSACATIENVGVDHGYACGADTICPRCKSPLRLIALIKNGDTIKKILSAMGLPTEAPKPYPARPPPSEPGDGAEYLN